MLFEQFYLPGLSHYSYAVGCPRSERIVVVDPHRDVQMYVEFARANRCRISHVLETHIHADYVSGARELAELSGAELCLSGYDKGERYEIAYAHTRLLEGDAVSVGSLRLEVLHTPGHSPEHVSFVLFDESLAEGVPVLMLTGDFLLMGSLGRPDILERDAVREHLLQLHRSIRNTLEQLPDSLEVYPAHGAGSACGGIIRDRRVSTLGYEKLTNPFLDPELTEKELARGILGSLPSLPGYFARMKAINAGGATRLTERPPLAALQVDRFEEQAGEGWTVIDVRDQVAFGAAHVPGSYGLNLHPKITLWAPWLISYERPVLLVADCRRDAEQARRYLSIVGLDDVRGYLSGGFQSWYQAGYPISQFYQIDPARAAALQDARRLQILDVRNHADWSRGHVPGSLHFPCGSIDEGCIKLGDRARMVALICNTGYASTAAASLLKQNGFEQIFHVLGGLEAWKQRGLPVVQPESSEMIGQRGRSRGELS